MEKRDFAPSSGAFIIVEMLFGFELLARFVGEPVEVKMAEGEDWVLAYRRGRRFYILDERKRYGPYSAVESLVCRQGLWWVKVKRAGRWYYLVNGRLYRPPTGLFDWKATLAGPIWLVRRRGKIYVKAAGKGPWLGPYDTVEGFTAFGKNWFFKAKKGEDWFFISRGKEFGPFDEVNFDLMGLEEDPLGCSGLTVYLKLKKGGKEYLFDGVRVFEGKGYAWAGGTWEARVFKDGKCWTVCEGKVFGPGIGVARKCGKKLIWQREKWEVDSFKADRILEVLPEGCFLVSGNKVIWAGDEVFVALDFDFEEIYSLDPLIWKDERGWWIEMPLGRLGPFERISQFTSKVWVAWKGREIWYVDPSTGEVRPQVNKTYSFRTKDKFWLEMPWGLAGPFDTTGITVGDCLIRVNVWGWGLRRFGKTWELWGF